MDVMAQLLLDDKIDSHASQQHNDNKEQIHTQ
jgi:hypothetical protein